MTPRKWSLAAFAVSALGVVAVGVGTWLPWLTVRPGYDGPVPAIYLPGMDAGIAGLDWIALLVTALALAGVAPTSVPRLGRVRAALVATFAGGLVVAVTILYLLSNVGSFLGTFVPDAGFYLTALGGVHLSVGGVLRLHALRSE
jgi:predicted membrane channel-forming protein YqfA (hemolysin III family)